MQEAPLELNLQAMEANLEFLSTFQLGFQKRSETGSLRTVRETLEWLANSVQVEHVEAEPKRTGTGLAAKNCSPRTRP